MKMKMRVDLKVETGGNGVGKVDSLELRWPVMMGARVKVRVKVRATKAEGDPYGSSRKPYRRECDGCVRITILQSKLDYICPTGIYRKKADNDQNDQPNHCVRIRR